MVLSYKDPVAPTKALIEFAKKNPELDIKVGVLDGKLLSKEDITALAELPSREGPVGQTGFRHGRCADVFRQSAQRSAGWFCASAERLR